MKKSKNNRKYVKGKPLRIPATVQLKYVNGVLRLVKQMTKETRAEITNLFDTDYAQTHFAHVGTMDSEGVGSQLRILINRIKSKYDQLFGRLAMGLSPWMVDSLNRSSASASRASVGEMPNLRNEGAKLTIDVKNLDKATKEILKASSARSTNFITSIPERYIPTVTNKVYDSITSGQGLKDLQEFFDKQDSTITNWSRNTALDQTRKTFNGLNAGRMKKIGITKGEWLHSGGSQHPRPLHVDFDGETFDLNEGAPVGDDGGMVMPGDEPNCRCTFSPIVMFDDEDNGMDDD